MSRLLPLVYAILLGVLCSLPGTVGAHDPGLSVVGLRLGNAQLTVHLTFARRDIESLSRIDVNHDSAVSQTEWEAAQSPLMALGQTLIDVWGNGQRLVAHGTTIALDASDALHFRFHFPWQVGSRLTVSAPVIAKLARGHRQYVEVWDQDGQAIVTHLLDAEHAVFELPRVHTMTVVTAAPSFWQFVRLGVEHILTGYDHLLFLFGLLVVGGGLWSAWRIITAFTLAHSITLALATLDIIRLQSSVVEPLIAASIVYVGLDNLWRRNLHQRWLLTFGFGLVHGLGFASVLRDLGIGAADAVGVLLLAFNGGVELGQLAIALLILPLMWKWQQRPVFFSRFAMVCSVLLTLAGAYWLFERIIFP